MANMEVKVKLDMSELEKLAIVLCKTINCKHNLRWKGIASCGLKNISISREGFCSNYMPKEAKE